MAQRPDLLLTLLVFQYGQPYSEVPRACQKSLHQHKLSRFSTITKMFQSLGKFQGFRGPLPETRTKVGQILYSGGVVYLPAWVFLHSHISASPAMQRVSPYREVAKSFALWPPCTFLVLLPATLHCPLFPDTIPLCDFPDALGPSSEKLSAENYPASQNRAACSVFGVAKLFTQSCFYKHD